MDVERETNIKKETNGALPKSSSQEKKGNRTCIIGVAIAAVFVLHFAWQVSFIQRGNLRITEDALNSARLDVMPVETAPVEVQPTEKTAEVKLESTVKKSETEETAKSVIPVKYVPPENKSLPVEMKKKTAREPAERLRRAEKLLTGS